MPATVLLSRAGATAADERGRVRRRQSGGAYRKPCASQYPSSSEERGLCGRLDPLGDDAEGEGLGEPHHGADDAHVGRAVRRPPA